ncbi:hypothetical protein KEM56_002771, partial [Ascosphaera pollenicola]
MAANTGYTAVPGRDSFDHAEYQPPAGPPPQHQHTPHPPYTQAPPSYQATDAFYGTTPRSEDDNVPDDFKVWCTHRFLGRFCDP